ncbi:PREDICTED: glutathione S-transferase T3-like [Camelina sativa]|uniref:Glutathione S-transferase T3-like n=1 Tax=Camelina sativa TaxID=90675 RepID=A0ABM0Y4X1_CAMSA|nr:PREDICTED: glutathione S-transferase T3-like [Camelina sativa]
MDSSNSYRFSLNFTDLLTSQLLVNNPESLPSFSPPIQTSSSPIQISSSHIQISSSPIQISSSSILQFSTQFSDVKEVDENSREARIRWTAQEDIVLISGWLNTSKDPVVGNGKKGGSFWEKIAFYYGASEAVAGKPKRGVSQCKQMWKKFNEIVNKFVGCYNQASSRRTSGQSEDNVLQMANQLYVNDQKVKFSLEHAWRELHHEQKWCSSNALRGHENSKRTKLDVSGTYSSSSNTTSHLEEEANQRPPGVKASKRKANKSGRGTKTEVNSLQKLEKAWEIREKEIAARERISKQRLLESLVGRTDLPEPKINLRKNLTDEMLG